MLCGHNVVAAGHGGTAVATAVAAGLMTAYAELRQLQFLLQSLLDALISQQPGNAADIICTPEFVRSVQKVTPRQNISCKSCCTCCWMP